MARKRTLIPKVVGILALVFSAFGLIGTLTMGLAFESELAPQGLQRSDLGSLSTWFSLCFMGGLVTAGLHIAAGVQSIRYKASGPKLMTIYAIMSLAFSLANVVLSFKLWPSHLPPELFEDVITPRLGLEFLSFAWPIVALVLINLRTSRQACQTGSSAPI